MVWFEFVFFAVLPARSGRLGCLLEGEGEGEGRGVGGFFSRDFDAMTTSYILPVHVNSGGSGGG